MDSNLVIKILSCMAGTKVVQCVDFFPHNLFMCIYMKIVGITEGIYDWLLNNSECELFSSDHLNK